MQYDLKKLPDARGARKKYPWEKLDKKGSAFIWKNLDDRRNIQASAVFQKIKVSIRKVDGVLHVIRVK
jgi:hypothetical protein